MNISDFSSLATQAKNKDIKSKDLWPESVQYSQSPQELLEIVHFSEEGNTFLEDFEQRDLELMEVAMCLYMCVYWDVHGT